MGECYAVFVGKNPGIYPSWASAVPQVVGFKGAIHQRYDSTEEAITAWMEFFRIDQGGASGSKSKGNGVQVKEQIEVPCEEEGENEVVRGIVRAAGKSGATDVDGTVLPGLVAAMEALDARVSQLEVDKWEVLMQMAHLMEQMARLMAKDAKK
ncbi:hypothetical protein PIB30_003117 [Stylosanthes scabra]|uniref:Ribonuclease H1 N-terminal domain-containing protein n=1 Tax=Stylosanthes scabra TaxID=79078 RepID=A0ABU6Y522_9FABA|nr:hypothetical protein [Stylosanthes scabra]